MLTVDTVLRCHSVWDNDAVKVATRNYLREYLSAEAVFVWSLLFRIFFPKRFNWKSAVECGGKTQDIRNLKLIIFSCECGSAFMSKFVTFFLRVSVRLPSDSSPASRTLKSSVEHPQIRRSPSQTSRTRWNERVAGEFIYDVGLHLLCSGQSSE
jgi:hypothetical protein